MLLPRRFHTTKTHLRHSVFALSANSRRKPPSAIGWLERGYFTTVQIDCCTMQPGRAL